ncbi:hypothetical protein D0T53_02105 [Dysgonomonas sp. 216]|uniref:DUF6769 family protein n=1 Tax=Dysgonomonas sp. 216 TaxID=2302934 RepID=UPI0013D68082|nr:DUF6769 family protein [Dysgonomonas sp. 216]NDW17708.1 hypothetical protein [Dysgonomonas sp. 216]
MSISFIFVAIAMLIAHAAIPHHDHGDRICFEKEQTADSHSHSKENQKGKSDSCCQLDKQDVIRKNNEEFKVNDCHNGLMCDYHFPPILLFLGDFFCLSPAPPEILNKPYLNLYASACLYADNSYRGPPQA